MKTAPDYERISHVLQRAEESPLKEEEAWVQHYLDLADISLQTKPPFLVKSSRASKQKPRELLESARTDIERAKNPRNSF